MRALTIIVIALAVLLVAFALVPQDVKDKLIPPGPSAYQKGVQNFGAANVNDFLSFTDPDYKFTVSYPIGYMADFINGTDERFHVAAQVPDSSAMVFSVSVTNESAQDAFDPSMQGLPFTVQSKGTMKINGKDALFVDGILNEDVMTERMYAKQVVLSCKDYTLVATGAIPSFLTEERITFDYMFTTLECPS